MDFVDRFEQEFGIWRQETMMMREKIKYLPNKQGTTRTIEVVQPYLYLMNEHR